MGKKWLDFVDFDLIFKIIPASGVPMMERTRKSIDFLHISSARAEVIFFD